MNVGFIGTGSMGHLLIEAFLRSHVLDASHIFAHNRTTEKVHQLAERFPGLRVAYSNKEIAEQCDLIFLCVRPLSFCEVINAIKPYLHSEQIVVSITSPVMLSQLEAELPCKAAKIIPSITNYANSGVTLCMYGTRINETDRTTLESLMKAISRPYVIQEQHTRISSDLSSCGPAFFALLLRHFIEAAVDVTNIPYEQANLLACEMLLGTGKLLTEGGMTPAMLEQRVAVPGGITEEGLQLMTKELDGMFQQLFRITHAKYEDDIIKIEKQWGESLF